jgi:uncharacterized protein (TIGR03000 family)
MIGVTSCSTGSRALSIEVRAMRTQHKWLAIGLGVATVCLGLAPAANAQYYRPAGGPYGGGAIMSPSRWSYQVGQTVYLDAAYRPVLVLETVDPYSGFPGRPVDGRPVGAGAGWYGYGAGWFGYGGGYYIDPFTGFPLNAGYGAGLYGAAAGYYGPGSWYGYAPSYSYEYGINRVIPVAGGYQTFQPIVTAGYNPPVAPQGMSQALPPKSKTAVLDLFVADPGAEISINGNKMQQGGQQRKFVTPELEPGKKYSFEVRAKWTQNGKQYDKTRTVTVYQGEQVGINFVADDRPDIQKDNKK